MNPPISLDETALARLRELDPDGRHGVMQRVLRAFEASLARMLDLLSAQLAAGADGDPLVVAGVAHTLKSSSASVGAKSLAQACAEIEHGLRSGAAADLDPQVRRLIAECEAALTAVATMLHSKS